MDLLQGLTENTRTETQFNCDSQVMVRTPTRLLLNKLIIKLALQFDVISLLA